MRRPLAHVAIVMFVLFAALFVNLNYLQVLRAEDLASDDRNTRQLIAEYDVRRGSIVAGDEVTEMATVTDTGGRLRYQRTYGDGPLYAPVTGFHSFVYGRAGIEQGFNDQLSGATRGHLARNLTDFLAGRQTAGHHVVTTIDPAAQRAAREALGTQEGAVVALEPDTGAIRALWSNPTYDPNRLASHDGSEVRSAWEELNGAPNKPMLNRALQETYPPGSTFKVVTAAAALAQDISPDAAFNDPVRQPLPLTNSTIGNFGGGSCRGGGSITFRQALVVSCNTTFAQLGLAVENAGLVEQAERFGLNADWDFPVPRAVSQIPRDLDPPSTAQSAIGQRDVRMTPLQFAMVVGAIANDGVLMTPRLASHVEHSATGEEVLRYPAEELVLPGRDNAQAMDPGDAATLTEMMIEVVSSGTGTAAQIPGVTVAGKTGTAQTAGAPTVAFVGFAPAENPEVAVAAVVEEGGEAGESATGGAVAAPIVRAVMEAALGESDEPGPDGEGAGPDGEGGPDGEDTGPSDDGIGDEPEFDGEPEFDDEQQTEPDRGQPEFGEEDSPSFDSDQPQSGDGEDTAPDDAITPDDTG